MAHLKGKITNNLVFVELEEEAGLVKSVATDKSIGRVGVILFKISKSYLIQVKR